MATCYLCPIHKARHRLWDYRILRRVRLERCHRHIWALCTYRDIQVLELFDRCWVGIGIFHLYNRNLRSDRAFHRYKSLNDICRYNWDLLYTICLFVCIYLYICLDYTNSQCRRLHQVRRCRFHKQVLFCTIYTP